ncbi:hypothetical protein ACFVTE_03815 [Arthrobacter sp. NPDC058097]|uniref:hypothetical protein n=1 Tax=Arthrobacter sp. NPDC058097 TaxID=3346340 RepID=UPI0036DA8A64
MPSTTNTIDIQVDDRKILDERLDAAVKCLQEAAILTGTHGIMVTRNKPGSYTATLSERSPSA